MPHGPGMFAGCYPLIIPSDQAELSDQSAEIHTSHAQGSKIFFPRQRIIQVWQRLAFKKGPVVLAAKFRFSSPVTIFGAPKSRNFVSLASLNSSQRSVLRSREGDAPGAGQAGPRRAPPRLSGRASALNLERALAMGRRKPSGAFGKLQSNHCAAQRFVKGCGGIEETARDHVDPSRHPSLDALQV